MLLYVVLLYYIYTLLYIGKKKRQKEERANWKKTGRRMPPTSSTVPRLSSAPSDVFTVHTIASRAPPRHRRTSSKQTAGQQTAGQRLDGMTSCPPRPLPRPSLLSVVLTVHAIARSSLPSSSAVPVILRPDLVRSFSSVRPSVFLFLVPRSPSCRMNAKTSPAAHYLTRSHHRQGGKGSPRPALVVIPSPPPRHRSTSNRDGRTSSRLSLPVW